MLLAPAVARQDIPYLTFSYITLRAVLACLTAVITLVGRR
jgi:hypothetical protein